MINNVTGYYLCPVKGCSGVLYMNRPDSEKMTCSKCGHEEVARK